MGVHSPLVGALLQSPHSTPPTHNHYARLCSQPTSEVSSGLWQLPLTFGVAPRNSNGSCSSLQDWNYDLQHCKACCSLRAASGRLIPPLGHVPGGYTVVTCHWSPVITCLLSCPLVTTYHASATLLMAESRDFAVCHSLPCPRAENLSDTPVRIRMSGCRTPRHAPRASLAPSITAVLRDGIHWPRTTADPVAVLREPPAPHSKPRDSPRHVGVAARAVQGPMLRMELLRGCRWA